MKVMVFLKNGSLYEISGATKTSTCRHYYHVIEDGKSYEFHHEAVEMVVTFEDEDAEMPEDMSKKDETVN